MRSVCALILIAAFGLLAPVAGAQEQSTTMTFFRAYQEALARGDLAGAEVAAESAVAASRRTNAEGGQTPVLLFNLARVRVSQGKWHEAEEPARQAYQHARAGRVGVDPLMSELLLARVRLEIEGFSAAQDVQGLLERAASREDLLGDRYDLAEHLGSWAQERRNYVMARRAWASAADTSRGAAIDANFARGRARAHEGIAILLQSFSRDLVVSPTMARQVRERLAEAHGLIRPFAFTPLPDGSLSAPQALYAQILAWDQALWSKVTSDEGEGMEPRLDVNPKSLDGVPICAVGERQGDPLTYPAQQAYRSELGAVVLRLKFSEQGEFERVDVAASAGNEEFSRSVARSAANWRYTIDRTNGCKPAPILFVPVVFYLR